ncbi:MAG: hypothetical protein D6814_07420 [Calditrichaeota bacterium]|nr:MAG: hypothetical protein D6814_07420 [Calditrichota bacterium]
MGYRELFLVLAAVLLLSMMSVSVNNNLSQGKEALQDIEIAHMAVGITQQFIEEAKSKKFDEVVGTLDPSNMPSGFTPWNALGHGAGETYPNFDDVDDYNNFSNTVSVQGIPFSVSIQVGYVQDTNPEQIVSTQTFFKKMTVTVTSSWFTGSVTLKHIFSYYGSDL